MFKVYKDITTEDMVKFAVDMLNNYRHYSQMSVGQIAKLPAEDVARLSNMFKTLREWQAYLPQLVAEVAVCRLREMGPSAERDAMLNELKNATANAAAETGGEDA